eukprot:PhM_4_TR15644/c1_g1_i3/m.6782
MSVGRQTFTDSPEDEVLVYTDAHTTGYGFVGGHPLVVVSRRWENTFLSKDMFYLEAIALKQAVCCLVREHRRIHVISDSYRYLGWVVTDRGARDWRQDFDNRTRLAWATLHTNERLWRSPASARTKSRLFSTLVVPVLTYAFWAYPMTAECTRSSFEMSFPCF